MHRHPLQPARDQSNRKDVFSVAIFLGCFHLMNNIQQWLTNQSRSIQYPTPFQACTTEAQHSNLGWDQARFCHGTLRGLKLRTYHDQFYKI